MLVHPVSGAGSRMSLIHQIQPKMCYILILLSSPPKHPNHDLPFCQQLGRCILISLVTDHLISVLVSVGEQCILCHKALACNPFQKYLKRLCESCTHYNVTLVWLLYSHLIHLNYFLSLRSPCYIGLRLRLVSFIFYYFTM